MNIGTKNAHAANCLKSFLFLYFNTIHNELKNLYLKFTMTRMWPWQWHGSESSQCYLVILTLEIESVENFASRCDPEGICKIKRLVIEVKAVRWYGKCCLFIVGDRVCYMTLEVLQIMRWDDSVTPWFNVEEEDTHPVRAFSVHPLVCE